MALPLSLAAFPQEVIVRNTELEPEFHHILNSRGEVIDYFSFNRGL